MSLDYKNQKHTVALQFSFSFERKHFFFKDAHYECDDHRINFVMGRNGIGKSTFLRILQGKLQANEQVRGTIVFDGRSYDLADKKTQELLRQVSRSVSQNYNTMVALDFSVAQNIGAAQLAMYPDLQPLPAEFKYGDMLRDVGIKFDMPVGQLSGGQRQILAIIMALQKPIQLLLLDEPTAALDETNAQTVMDFLGKLAQLHQITMVCITHDQELIHTYARHQYCEIVKNSAQERHIEKRVVVR